MQLGYIARGVALPPSISPPPPPTSRSIARVALALAISRECRGKRNCLSLHRANFVVNPFNTSNRNQFHGATRVASSYFFFSRLLVEYLNFETAQTEKYIFNYIVTLRNNKETGGGGEAIKKVGRMQEISRYIIIHLYIKKE